MAHNDHLQEPIIEKKNGAAKGVFYSGIALTASEFILIAPSIDKLREHWSTFSEQPLNETKCLEVGLFSAKDIKELSDG